VTVVGITMVRDEADIIETTLRHMKTQVDAIVVANRVTTTSATPPMTSGGTIAARRSRR